MKLSHVLEARYAFPQYVQWVVDTLEKGGGEKSLENIPKDDTKTVLDQLTKQFGKPHYLEFAGEEERNYYLWQNHAGGPMSYDIAFWPDWGELLVHRIRGVPVNEAQIAHNTIVDEIKDAIANRNPWEEQIEDVPYRDIVSMLTREFGPPAWQHEVVGGLYKTTWRIDREELTAVKYPDNFTEVYLV